MRADGENLEHSVSVVIPVYGGGATVPDLVARLESVLIANFKEFEVLLINDGSPDNSWEEILNLSREHPWVRGLSMMRNYGQHNAVLCGIRAARFELILTMDDDLQHPPEEIPKLMVELSNGFDVVYGTPQGGGHGLLRGVLSRMTKRVMESVMGVEGAKNVSPFRVFRTKIRDSFAHYEDSLVNIDVLLTWGTTRFAGVPVKHNSRQTGSSSYNIPRLIVHAVNMVTGFSAFPLQVASLVGLGSTFLGVLVLAYVLGRFALEGNPVQGFPFLASVITIFSGAQLFALGIIGEYLSRVHFRTIRRPTYVVGESCQNNNKLEIGV